MHRGYSAIWIISSLEMGERRLRNLISLNVVGMKCVTNAPDTVSYSTNVGVGLSVYYIYVV